MARRSTIASSILCMFLFAVLGVGIWQRDWLADWVRLRSYTAPASVSALAADDTLTNLGQRYFYVNHPDIEDQAVFNTHCVDASEQRAVLGCYTGNRRGIYLYNVTDARLAGVQQVTAAHEMLHQAYDRLSSSERTRIDGLLLDYCQNHLTNQSVKDKIDGYPNDQAVRVNEMHSILGTEVRDLTPELETYYKQYFSNRLQIVGYAEKYQAEFTKRQQEVAAYDQQLSNLKTQIDANEADLQTKQATLSSKLTTLKQYPSAQDPAGYNALARDYNSLVNAYNKELSQTQQLINQYNSIVAERNAIAVQEQSLQQALDSRLNPATTQ